MRDVKTRLTDILEAIERIHKNLAGRKLYELNELEIAGIIHYLQILGESCRSMPVDFREKHPEIDWVKIIGMRNILVHQYFEVDFDIIRLVIEEHLTKLREKVEVIIEDL